MDCALHVMSLYVSSFSHSMVCHRVTLERKWPYYKVIKSSSALHI